MVEQRVVAAVVIGRNEGQRLPASILSAQAAGLPVVYIDSGSHDGSAALARSLGVEVHELDPSRPFSAGRARNEGVDKLLAKRPELKYVMFLDGDCVLHESFPGAACATLDTHPDCAIVTGHLSERHPDASVYNRLCSIEWRSPAGRIDHMNGLGGIMMARVSSFRAVGGFDPQAIAGEEPDLGARLILGGFYILKIDTPMATHDAEILAFQQWWRRAVRAGHALADRYTRHGQSELRDGRREFFSALFWGVALPVVILLLLWPSRGLSLFLIVAYAAFGWRVYRYYRSNGLSSPDARLVTRFIIYAKFAQAVGIYKFYRAKRRGRFRIIEYK